MTINLPYGETLLVQKRAKFGGVYDAIAGGKERWDCTTDDRAGFGTILCDTLKQAVYYFTQMPWVSRSKSLCLTFVPYYPKGRKPKYHTHESYELNRTPDGWCLECR